MPYSPLSLDGGVGRGAGASVQTVVDGGSGGRGLAAISLVRMSRQSYRPRVVECSLATTLRERGQCGSSVSDEEGWQP